MAGPRLCRADVYLHAPVPQVGSGRAGGAEGGSWVPGVRGQLSVLQETLESQNLNLNQAF